LEQISRKLEEETKRRQKAEEASQKSEEMYRDLFEIAPNANFSISAEDGSILRCNTASMKLLGYDKAALMGMKVFDLYADTPYGIFKAQKVFKRFKKGESIRNVELQMKHKNGYPIWVSLSVEPVKVNGNIIESRSMVIDISERKRSEEVLRKSEHYYRSLLVNMHEDILVIDRDYLITDVNKTFIATTGYRREEVIGRRCYEVSHGYREPCDKCGEECVLHEVFDTGKPCNCRHEHIAADGSKIWVDILLSPHKNEKGTVTHVIEAIRDMTDIIQVEDEFRESEERMRAIFEAADSVSFIMTDLTGTENRILEFSPGAERMFEYSCDEILGKPIAMLHLPEDVTKIPKVIETMDQRKAGFTRESTLVRKSGERFPAFFTTCPIFDAEGNTTAALSVAIDISDQVRAEKELEKRTNDLNERVKELNCLYGISQLVEKRGISLEEIIQGTANLIPTTWRYPETTCARIIMGGQKFKTKNFKKTDWRQACDIIVHGELSGTVEVYYLEEKPACHEGPFLKEERTLINTIAGRLARITERMQTEKEVRLLKEKYEDLYHNAPISYLSLDTNGIIIECNNAILDKLGYSKKKFIGKHMMTFLTEESVASFKEDFPELIKTGKLMGVERQLVTKSGEIIDVQFSVSGEYDEHGKLIKTRASFEDISGLKRAEEYIHSLTHSLINAHESERRMISRELHDRIAQDLSTLKIGFDTLLYNQAAVSPEESQKAAGFSEIFKNTIAAVRDLSYNLRPPLLDEMGLVEAISHFCESFSEAHGLNVHFNTAGMDNLKLNFETEINLYRLVQEGLNNIRKHAEAADAFVKLIAASPNIILRIEDNGQGFDVERRLEAATNEKRMGLRSMEERTCLLGGKMTVESPPLKGTKILIKIPQKKGKNGTKENDTGR